MNKTVQAQTAFNHVSSLGKKKKKEKEKGQGSHQYRGNAKKSIYYFELPQ